MNKNMIGKIIQEERIKQKLTRKQLATMAGCTSRAISYWEIGQQDISVKMADEVLKALGVTFNLGKKEQ